MSIIRKHNYFLYLLIFYFFISINALSQTPSSPLDERVGCTCNSLHPLPTNLCNWTLSRIVDVESPSAGNPTAGTGNIDFVFDTFSKYNAGITINGGTLLKLIVADRTDTLPQCSWKLNMTITGNGSGSSEWKTDASYGTSSSAPKPTLDLLRMQISNGCETPYLPDPSKKWRTPFELHGQTRAIIDPNSFVSLGAGALCGLKEANTPGSYLTIDYHEMTFLIDYRVVPSVGYAPGKYSIVLKYCLTEQ